MMPVLVVKNISSEGPGTIANFLAERGIGMRVAEMHRGELPDADDADALVVMGGPMSVNDVQTYPYLRKEEDLVRDFIARGRKVLGICLGAQMIAKALGARVYKGPETEVGWHDIELVEGGMRDPLMQRLAVHPRAGDFWRKFRVFHWHGETFDIPEGCVRLAKSKSYPNQAFRYGNSVYAFQFHIEVTKEMIFDWLGGEGVDMRRLEADTAAFYDDYAGRARSFYEVFFGGGQETRQKRRAGSLITHCS